MGRRGDDRSFGGSAAAAAVSTTETEGEKKVGALAPRDTIVWGSEILFKNLHNLTITTFN